MKLTAIYVKKKITMSEREKERDERERLIRPRKREIKTHTIQNERRKIKAEKYIHRLK